MFAVTSAILVHGAQAAMHPVFKDIKPTDRCTALFDQLTLYKTTQDVSAKNKFQGMISADVHLVNCVHYIRDEHGDFDRSFQTPFEYCLLSEDKNLDDILQFLVNDKSLSVYTSPQLLTKDEVKEEIQFLLNQKVEEKEKDTTTNNIEMVDAIPDEVALKKQNDTMAEHEAKVLRETWSSEGALHTASGPEEDFENTDAQNLIESWKAYSNDPVTVTATVVDHPLRKGLKKVKSFKLVDGNKLVEVRTWTDCVIDRMPEAWKHSFTGEGINSA